MDLTALIDKAYEDEPQEEARRYVGASGIGSSCDAELQLSLRGFPNDPPSPRTKRIFLAGHRIEEVVVADLRKAGIDVIERDKDGKQFGVVMFGGHVRCHTDGIIIKDGKSCILEVKSMKNAFFNSFKSKGIQTSHPHYYQQMQMMLNMFEFDEGVFIAYNKDTSEYHHEWVKRDMFAFAAQTLRITQVVVEGKGKRAFKDPSNFKCKHMCFKRTACWGAGTITVDVACHTCQLGRPVVDDTDDRHWYCTAGLKFEDGCGSWTRYEPEAR